MAGGGSVLSTFYQPLPYYSGRDLYILIPKEKKSITEMLFYANCIRINKYKYNYGRQANKTLKDILIPSKMPKDFLDISIGKIITITSTSLLDENIEINIPQWKYHQIIDLFEVESVETISAIKLKEFGHGAHPYVTRSNINNGVAGTYNYKTETGKILVVNVLDGFCTYQPLDFSASMVQKLIPKFELNEYIAMFLTTVINAERHRFNYGRESGKERLKEVRIKLPTELDGTPDWEFMENYIKSLPYSSSLKSTTNNCVDV